MQNPFEDYDYDNVRETDKFINTYIANHRNKLTYCYYVIIGLIYILECFTSTLGGLNHQKSTGFFDSNFTLQYWLLVSGIYSIIGLILIYQFNQKKYENKLYFIFYDFIKICWLIIGTLILFGFNQIIGCNFIIGYSLFYIMFSILFTSYMFRNTLALSF
jgi:hypothetical protein